MIRIDKQINELYLEKDIESIKTKLEETWITKLLEQKWWIKFDDLTNFSTKELKELFWAWFEEIKEFLINTRKNNPTKTINEIKTLLSLIIDLTLNDDVHNHIWWHLREKQKEFVISIFKFITRSKNQSWYIHSATSTWKTVIFADVIKSILKSSPDKNVLILVPSLTALERSKEEFKKLWIDFWLYYWEQKILWKNITIATRQSVTNGLKKEIFSPNDYDLIISDEIHNFLWEETVKMMNFFKCKKVWFTASPELLNKDVEMLFVEKLWEYLIEEAQEDWYLPEIDDSITIEMDDENFNVLEKQNWDYTQASLEKFDIEKMFPQVEELLNDKLKNKQIAIFCSSVASSIKLTKYLQDNGIKSKHIDWTTTNTKDIKQEFEDREIQVITSCDKIKESWDSDIIDWAIILRPTLSPAVYIQMIWRPLHWKEINEKRDLVPKKEVIVVDLVNSREDILSRTITYRWLKHLLKNRKSWNSNKINIKDLKYINEFLLYYDFKEELTEEKIWEILEEYRELIWEEEDKFYENIENLDYYKDKEETIIFDLISNNFFGRSYEWREKQIEMNLYNFLRILKIYKKVSLLKIIKAKERFATKQYFENISFEDFREDLKNITKFTVNNKEEKINKTSFRQIHRWFLKYKLWINREKESYSWLIVKLFKKVKLWEIKSFEELEKQFNLKKSEIDELLKEKSLKLVELEYKTTKEYFSKITFEKFKKDLFLIKNLTTKTEEEIHGFWIRKFCLWIFNYILCINEDDKLFFTYYWTIIKLLKSIKNWEVNSFEELENKFNTEKLSININFKVSLNEFFNNLKFEDLLWSLLLINKFTTINKKEKILWENFRRFIDIFLTYKLWIKSNNHRSSYNWTIVKLFERVKKGEINSFEELEFEFKKEKIKIDKLIEEKRSNLEILEHKTVKEYFKKTTFEVFRKDLLSIINLKIKNKEEKIKLFSIYQIVDWFLNHMLWITIKKNRTPHHWIMVKLLEKVKNWEINSFEELEEQFKIKKDEIDEKKK